MGEGRGGSPCSKSFEALFAKNFGKYWNVGPIKKFCHGCPKWANTKVTSQCPKERVGGSRPLLDNVQNKGAFFLMASLILAPFLSYIAIMILPIDINLVV